MRRRRLALGLTAAALLASAAGSAQESSEAAAVDGRALLDENCLYCHDDSYIRSLNLDREAWGEVLDLMIGMGMPPLDPEVQEQILDYLEEEHGPRDPSGSGGQSGGGEAGVAGDLPWAYPLYRPNPLIWR